MINLLRAKELLREAVETQGKDFVYATDGSRTCRYRPLVTNDPLLPDPEDDQLAEDDPRRKTGCLVGVALSLAGETGHLEITGSALVVPVAQGITPLARGLFKVAQEAQDVGKTWGEALRAAREWASYIPPGAE